MSNTKDNEKQQSDWTFGEQIDDASVSTHSKEDAVKQKYTRLPAHHSEPSFWKRHQRALKLCPLVILLLLSNIPLSMVYNLAIERLDYRAEATRTTVKAWGNSGRTSGPILQIPVERTIQVKNDDKWEDKKVEEIVFIMPNELSVTADAEHHTRQKGIYDVLLGDIETKMEGHISKTRLESILKETNVRPLLQKASLIVAIPETSGIKAATLNWQGEQPVVRPISNLPLFENERGTGLVIELSQNIYQMIEDENYTGTFSVSLKLAATDHFKMPISASSHTLHVRSNWPHPSFSGAYLPDEREISEQGFTAHFTTNALQSGLTHVLTHRQRLDSEQSFELAFKNPTDAYAQFLRTTKYGMLLILLTFGMYFIFELLSRERLHIIQYGLVGLSLSVFFLLLLGFSEHVGFGFAYLIASCATVGLVAIYLSAVLSNKKFVGLQSGLMGLTLWFMHHLVGMEQGSLLVGALGAFATLSTIMWTSRNIDWYSLGKTQEQPQPMTANTSSLKVF